MSLYISRYFLVARFIRYAWEDWLVGRLLCAFIFLYRKYDCQGRRQPSARSLTFRFWGTKKWVQTCLVRFVMWITQKVSDYLVVCPKPFWYCARVYKRSLQIAIVLGIMEKRTPCVLTLTAPANRSHITWIILNYTRDIGITLQRGSLLDYRIYYPWWKRKHQRYLCKECAALHYKPTRKRQQ